MKKKDWENMKTELEKRVEEFKELNRNHHNHKDPWVQHEFRKVADLSVDRTLKFILEMPEVEEFFTISTLLVSTYLSHFDYCDSLYDYEDEDEGACNCGLDTEEQCFNNALSKLRELGVVL